MNAVNITLPKSAIRKLAREEDAKIRKIIVKNLRKEGYKFDDSKLKLIKSGKFEWVEFNTKGKVFQECYSLCFKVPLNKVPGKGFEKQHFYVDGEICFKLYDIRKGKSLVKECSCFIDYDLKLQQLSHNFILCELATIDPCVK